jgi:hypothetical protein
VYVQDIGDLIEAAEKWSEQGRQCDVWDFDVDLDYDGDLSKLFPQHEHLSRGKPWK